MGNNISYDYITEYIRNTISPNDQHLTELEDYAKSHHIPIVQPEVSKIIYVLGKIANPKKVLEIGTAIGYSAILISRVLDKGGSITTIERYQKMIEQAKKNIEKAGLLNIINILEGNAEDILPKLKEKYDLIFMDAAKGQYPEFLPHCIRLLKTGGILISDNVLYQGMVANNDLIIRRKKTIVKRMRSYLETICNHELLDTSIIPIGDGVALSFKKG